MKKDMTPTGIRARGANPQGRIMKYTGKNCAPKHGRVENGAS
jgi:hypothetical protein